MSARLPSVARANISKVTAHVHHHKRSVITDAVEESGVVGEAGEHEPHPTNNGRIAVENVNAVAQFYRALNVAQWQICQSPSPLFQSLSTTHLFKGYSHTRYNHCRNHHRNPRILCGEPNIKHSATNRRLLHGRG
ncbi:MAG: hypothetical protein WC365_07500 [Candidatus Babeliales bacterium]